MVKVLVRHTGLNPKKLSLDTLGTFGIGVNHLYSITTDNGSNMLNALKRIIEEQGLATNNHTQNETLATQASTSTDEEMESCDEIDEVSENGEEYEIMQDDDCETEVKDQVMDDERNSEDGDFNNNEHELTLNDTLMGFRCAAHTHQLAVLDALKATSAKNTLNFARRVVKELRNQTIMICIRQLKKKNPILDGKTRWGSSYDMIARLQKLRTFCEGMSEDSEHTFLKLSELQWEKNNTLVTALKPAKIASKLFQSEQLNPGDFYVAWLNCKSEIEKVINSTFSKVLLARINARELQLTSNDAFRAAIFLIHGINT